MIFVCIGSRDYQFNRLLQALDELVASGELTEEVFAQIGQSQYTPKHYRWERYLDSQTFRYYQQKAELIVSHAGVGTLLSALKMGKTVVAVPRYVKFGEHIDDHQTQIAEVLCNEGYLYQVKDIADLGKTIALARKNPLSKEYDRPSYIPGLIKEFIGE